MLAKPKPRNKRKQKSKSLGKLKKELWDLVSEYVRRKDADHNGYVACYTCGTVRHWKEQQAGHAIPGRTNAVLYDLEVLRPQGVECNIFGNGKHHIFTTKLIEEHGMEWWQAKLVASNQTVKYTRGDIYDMAEEFRQRLKGLEGA